MRHGLPVVIGPTKTMGQPRIQKQNLTSSTDAFSGLAPENQHKGADGNTPSAKLQALTTKTFRAMRTGIGGAVEQGAAEALEEEGPQPSYGSSFDKPFLGIVKNRSVRVSGLWKPLYLP